MAEFNSTIQQVAAGQNAILDTDVIKSRCVSHRTGSGLICVENSGCDCRPARYKIFCKGEYRDSYRRNRWGDFFRNCAEWRDCTEFDCNSYSGGNRRRIFCGDRGNHQCRKMPGEYRSKEPEHTDNPDFGFGCHRRENLLRR